MATVAMAVVATVGDTTLVVDMPTTVTAAMATAITATEVEKVMVIMAVATMVEEEMDTGDGGDHFGDRELGANIYEWSTTPTSTIPCSSF